MSEQSTKPSTTEVEIEVTVDNHTHQGKPCPKGTKITVSEQTAAMLQKAWAQHASK